MSGAKTPSNNTFSSRPQRKRKAYNWKEKQEEKSLNPQFQTSTKSLRTVNNKPPTQPIQKKQKTSTKSKAAKKIASPPPPPPSPPPPPPPPTSVPEIVVTKNDQDKINKALQKTKREAKKAAKKAAEEGPKRLLALQHQKKVLLASATSYAGTYQPVPPKRKDFVDPAKPLFVQGDYVNVNKNPLNQGVSGWGGSGYVVNVNGHGAATTCDVKYELLCGGGVEKNIVLNRLTEMSLPLITMQPRLRLKATPRLDPSPETTTADDSTPTLSNIGERLSYMYSRGFKDGWRRREVDKTTGKRLNDDEIIQMKIDYYELNAIISTHKGLGININSNSPKNSSGQFKNKKRTNPISIAYLQTAWGVGKNFIKDRLEQERKKEAALSAPSLLGEASKHASTATTTNVIDSLEAAKRNFTPINCFLQNERNRIRRENLDSLSRTESAAINAQGRLDWELLSSGKFV